MSHFTLQLDTTRKELLEYTDSRHLAMQSRRQPDETLFVTKLNDVISHLRFYGIVKQYPIRFQLRQAGEQEFEFQVKGITDLRPEDYSSPKGIADDNFDHNPEALPPSRQYELIFKVNSNTSDEQLQKIWNKLDRLQVNWNADQHTASPAYLKPFGTIPLKPHKAYDIINKHRDNLAQFLTQWLKRQSRNHLWDITVTCSKLPTSYVITVRRTGWFNHQIKYTLGLRQHTLWRTVEGFRQKITRLEMAKQQHQLAIQNDAQNAIEIVRTYQKTLHKEAQLWSNMLNQWSNQTGTQPMITSNKVDQRVFLL